MQSLKYQHSRNGFNPGSISPKCRLWTQFGQLSKFKSTENDSKLIKQLNLSYPKLQNVNGFVSSPCPSPLLPSCQHSRPDEVIGVLSSSKLPVEGSPFFSSWPVLDQRDAAGYIATYFLNLDSSTRKYSLRKTLYLPLHTVQHTTSNNRSQWQASECFLITNVKN